VENEFLLRHVQTGTKMRQISEAYPLL